MDVVPDPVCNWVVGYLARSLEVQCSMYGKPQRSAKEIKRKRFAVGARVLVKNPGVIGVVTNLEDEPKALWEYWHTIETDHLGQFHEPGCNLELVPTPMTNAETKPATTSQNIHLHGDHSRVNVNSTDHSTNLGSTFNNMFFSRMKESARDIADETEREAIINRLDELEKAHESTEFLSAYERFAATAANHMTIFGPFLPALLKMVSHLT
jgi:hypothetical protein